MSRSTRWIQVAAAGVSLLAGSGLCAAQTPDAPPQQAVRAAAVTDGGTIHGSVKSGPVPLPGVSVTATSSVTGKKFATTTDVDGNYSMTVPKDGAYTVRAELAAFAVVSRDVQMTATSADQTAEFALQLASRAPATPAVAVVAGAPAKTTATANTPPAGPRPAGAGGYGGGRIRTQQGRGTQTLGDGEGVDANTLDATTGGGDAATPSMGGMADAATESIAVSGVQGQTNGLANLSEDQLNRQIQGAQDNIRGQGGNAQDQQLGVVSLLQGIQAGGAGLFGVGGGPGGGPGGPGGGGGRGGPGGGGRGGGGQGGGAFRNFNPAQPHGSIFYQGGNSALNSGPWQPSLVPEGNPSAYQNRFGLSITGTPYIPGVTKPDTRQFAFINLTGQKNLNAFAPNPVRVPTALERMGNFSQSFQEVSGAAVPVTVYNPATGVQFGGAGCTNATVGCNVIPTSQLSPQALALLNYYPLCNINCLAAQSDPTLYNYQTISNAGSNNVAINARYQRQLGQQTNNQGRGARGGGGGGGQRGGQRPNPNAPPVLRQNINLQYNYSHSASDIRNIFLPLGGATESNGYALNLGYTVSYGRISNNASLSWNRSNSEQRNYFTNTANNPTITAGLTVPNQANNFADPKFYNGLPSLGITNFAGLSNTTPSNTIGQTISFSDFVAWRHKKHNFRFGGDIRRVHSDSIGGNTPLGSYSFTGYATSAPADQVAGNGGSNSGSGFADFLLGLPQSTSIQAGTYKDYLRENVYDWYATDDWRLLSNVTLNYGLRYEYFGPYSEKYNHLVNLTGISGITAAAGTPSVGCVTPSGTSYTTPGGVNVNCAAGSHSLVNPDYAMYAPRFGFAYSPKFKHTKNVVIRGGYGINYNTGQYATFAKLLSHQAPFSVTQNNTAYAPTVNNPAPTNSGCTTETKTNPTPTMTLANGFNCSTLYTINNSWAVDPSYKLGMVQIYNLNIQKVVGALYVLNLGYNGAKGNNLDTVGTPDASPALVFPGTIAAFDYERSLAASRTNSLVFGVVRRQHKGIALSATYTYLHAIDNASGVGGAVGTPVQNYYNLNAEEGNSSFDQRHNVTGTFLGELPFGPNREFLNKGGVMSKILDGFSLSGTFTFGTGNYYTPTYSNSASESAAANTLTLRPDRVPTQSLKGPGKVKEFFNPAAFTKPGCAAYAVAGTVCPASASSGATGTASQGSIEGPGTVSVSAALSRTVQLGGTNSFEARVQATNVFNTVQYSGINTTENAATFGQVTSAAAMRALVVIARYRF